MKKTRNKSFLRPEEKTVKTNTFVESYQSSEDIVEFERVLEKIAGYSKTHIEREHKRTSVYIRTLEEMLKTSVEINSSFDIDYILNRIMNKAVEVLKAERGFISLYDSDSNLQIEAAHRVSQMEIEGNKVFDYDFIVTQVIISGEAVFSSDAAHDDRYAHLVSKPSPQHSFVCAPLKAGCEVFGAVFLENHNKSRIFTESDYYLLRMYGELVSATVARARSYQALSQLKDYKNALSAVSPNGIVVVTPEGWIADINQAAFEILDLNIEAVKTLEETSQPTNFIEIIPSSEKPRWSRMINTVLTTHQEFIEPRYTHNTGYLEKILSVKIYPITDFPYSDYGMAILIEDVSERVLMEKYLIVSEKMVARGEMAARVAHKLNNFLSVIANHTELLNMNLDRGRTDKVKFNSRTIFNTVFKIKDFLDELVQSPRTDSRVISFNINHLINDLLFSLHNDPRFKEVYYTMDLQEDIPNIEIDVKQMQKVVLNILNNAIDAIDEKALLKKDNEFKHCLTIESKYEKSTNIVSIKITDNGTGIKKRHLDKIFNIHFSTKKNGHGLGLYNAKSIIEQHHGRIFIESQTGKSTSITITLPRFQPRQPKIKL